MKNLINFRETKELIHQSIMEIVTKIDWIKVLINLGHLNTMIFRSIKKKICAIIMIVTFSDYNYQLKFVFISICINIL